MMKQKKKYTLGHRIGKIMIRILDSTVNLAVLVLLLLLFVLGCYSLWDTHMVYSQADSARYEIYKPSTDEKLPSFADLQIINPDTQAWLTVNDTGIDYPVAYTDNNETYVNTDIFGNYSLTGALFLDYEAKPDFSDFNSIIYGHHMEKDKMFGDLDQYRSEAYFNSHKYGNLYYSGRDHGLEFFAFLEADAYDSSIYQVAVTLDERKQAYLDNIYAKATYSRDIGVTIEDHMVLLSTCSSDTTNGRFILVGKITDSLYPQAKENVDKNGAIHTIDSPGDIYKYLAGMKWWVWVVIIIWIILLIILLCWLLNRKKKGRMKKMSKIVIFYSRADENYFGGKYVYVNVGNTEKVAEQIAEAAGAKLHKIEQKEPYSPDYKTCVAQAKDDLKSQKRPILVDSPENLDDYDEIYLGYPIYCGTMPMAVFTFLEQYDWTGKVIHPFATHEGSGLGTSEKDIKKVCKGAVIKKGLAVLGSKADEAGEAVTKWVTKD